MFCIIFSERRIIYIETRWLAFVCWRKGMDILKILTYVFLEALGMAGIIWVTNHNNKNDKDDKKGKK